MQNITMVVLSKTELIDALYNFGKYGYRIDTYFVTLQMRYSMYIEKQKSTHLINLLNATFYLSTMMGN